MMKKEIKYQQGRKRKRKRNKSKRKRRKNKITTTIGRRKDKGRRT